MTMHMTERADPGEIEPEIAARAVQGLENYLRQHPDEQNIEVTVATDKPEPLVLPREVVSLLAFILTQAAAGNGVSIVPSHAELTTQQAADMLNVSRPYLIGLLEAGEIPFRLVGRHRRVRYNDMKEYKRRSDAETLAAADELTALGQELGGI
ncbi:excisionase family DNA-binding protein [Nocardia sp. NPDC050712]|uniref:excisionase family DNA-binding protein n=1 Tax=Nocardia sp. NPDC050712 TaxID=3155518 RepID=UPI003405E3C0